MPEPAASASESRDSRIIDCLWCNDTLPKHSRKDAKYCCDRCRHNAAVDRRNTGKVYRVQELKKGGVSIVIHVDKTSLTASDVITWVRN